MGWPLILSLAGTAAQAESESHGQNVADKYATEEALRKQQALNRALEQQARSKEQQAMAAELSKAYKPASVARESIVPQRSDMPEYLKNLEQIQGLAQLMGGLGSYWGQHPDSAPPVGGLWQGLKNRWNARGVAPDPNDYYSTIG